MVESDRGKDFLSQAVASVLAGFAVAIGPLPGYTPHLKGSVETVDGAMERMFAAGPVADWLAQRGQPGPVWSRAGPADVLTTWCAISAGACWPGGSSCWGYRSAARSETRPATAR